MTTETYQIKSAENIKAYPDDKHKEKSVNEILAGITQKKEDADTFWYNQRRHGKKNYMKSH